MFRDWVQSHRRAGGVRGAIASLLKSGNELWASILATAFLAPLGAILALVFDKPVEISLSILNVPGSRTPLEGALLLWAVATVGMYMQNIYCTFDD